MRQKSGLYTTGDDQLNGWTKKKLRSTSQSQLAPKKIMVTVWWSFAGLIHYSLLNPCENSTSENYAQQIDEMHQKLQPLQLALFNRTSPVLPNDNILPHVKLLYKLDYEVLPPPPYSPLTNRLSFLQASRHFLQGKCFHSQQDPENAFQQFFESPATDFYATGMNLFLTGKNCVDCNCSHLINKNVSEHSYNDLKFTT